MPQRFLRATGLILLDISTPFEIPDFQGQLRLMAVAFSAHKVGSAVASMTVRDPVVTSVSLPRFLAPGDAARIGVSINNLEGAAGDYHLIVSANGAAGFAAPVDRTLRLSPGGNFTDGFGHEMASEHLASPSAFETDDRSG
jgi:uncharacterized protein YfaS (alpha-2-macroglobulin family)